MEQLLPLKSRISVVLTTLSALVAFGVAEPAQAQIQIQLDAGAAGPFAAQLGLDLNALEAELAQELNNAFALAEPQSFLKGMADAAAFSNKGLGVDYATREKYFVLGAAANIALSTGDNGFKPEGSDRPLEGIAPNVSILAGLNLGVLGLDRATIYANFFKRGFAYQDLDIDLENYGAHLQLNFFGGDKDASNMLKWGGLDVTTGFVYSKLTGSIKQNGLETTVPIPTAAGQEVQSRLISNGDLSITTKAVTVPFELTTSLRFLYFLTLYGGVGIDIQLGDANMDINLSGNLEAEDPIGGGTVDLGNVDITAAEAGDPQTGKVRFLAGLQISLWKFHIFAQGNLLPDAAASVAVGGRIGW